jgi:hypothetical protein
MSEVLTKDETALVRLTALLGEDVFFVPCEWGTKAGESVNQNGHGYGRTEKGAQRLRTTGG